jgi:hypothetical protein
MQPSPRCGRPCSIMDLRNTNTVHVSGSAISSGGMCPTDVSSSKSRCTDSSVGLGYLTNMIVHTCLYTAMRPSVRVSDS